MLGDKRAFYEKIASDSIKDIKIRRNTKPSNKITRNIKSTYNKTARNNKTISSKTYRDYKNVTRDTIRNKTKNGMVRFDENENNQKSKFLTQCLICVFILAIFYYLSQNDFKISQKIIEPTKAILNGDIKLKTNGTSSFLGNSKIKKDGVVIDDKTIQEMEKQIEIENLKKK